MMLATSEDYDQPHIDWHCKRCGEVYCSTGYPADSRCTNGHSDGWKPESEQIQDYIDKLQSLAVGDGLVVVGNGPAPLMAPVETTSDSQLTTESIDSPSRVIQWDEDDETIMWAKASDEHPFWRQVYHVERVEVKR